MFNLALLGSWHVHTGGFVVGALKTGEAQLKVVWDDEERGKDFARQKR